VVNRSIVYSFETAGKFYNVRLKETARKTGLMSGEGDGRVLTRIAEVWWSVRHRGSWWGRETPNTTTGDGRGGGRGCCVSSH
jgi:hypothetical protein